MIVYVIRQIVEPKPPPIGSKGKRSGASFAVKRTRKVTSTRGRHDRCSAQILTQASFVVVGGNTRLNKFMNARTALISRPILSPNAEPPVWPLRNRVHGRNPPGLNGTNEPVLDSGVGPTVKLPSGKAQMMSFGAVTDTPNLFARFCATPFGRDPVPQDKSRIGCPVNSELPSMRRARTL